MQLPDEHQHFSQRAPWLRAAVLGANDGLVSVASLMLGVEGGTHELHPVVLAGVAGLVAGALSMAVGEFVSVSSQRYRSPFTYCIFVLDLFVMYMPFPAILDKMNEVHLLYAWQTMHSCHQPFSTQQGVLYLASNYFA